MYRCVLIALLSLLIVGCAGVAVGTYSKKEWARTNFMLANERNQFSFEKREAPYGRSEVIDQWGEPDDVQSHKACEILIYRDGTSWAGAGAFVGFIPVPLVVPTGSYKNRFYLQENTVVGLVQEYGEVDRSVGYVCGSNECSSSSGDKVNEPEVDAEEAIGKWCAKSL